MKLGRTSTRRLEDGLSPTLLKPCGVAPPRSGAFTRLELAVVTIAVLVLLSICWPALGRVRDDDQTVVDFENGRRITTATHLFAADNSDYMPHTSWGMQGGDNWVYGLQNNGRLAGLPVQEGFPDAAGESAAWFSAGSRSAKQLEFYKLGQLAKYLPRSSAVICPKDFAEVNVRTSPKLLSWIGRSQKLTSYCWNASLIDFGALPDGVTRRISDFRPNDIQFWEAPEQESFSFNDASNQPSESVSQRHGAVKFERGVLYEDWGGSSPIGRIGGSVDLMSWRTFTIMAGLGGALNATFPNIAPTSPDNQLWIGPINGK